MGSVRPYRGGIAQYTDSLVAALQKTCDVSVYSFYKQYPTFLYPGESDMEKGATWQQDVHYMLGATNLLSWHRTARHISKSRPDVVLIDWWTLFWQPAWWYIAGRLRSRGLKVVYICHNVYDHDAPGYKKALTKWWLRRSDGYIVHAQEEAQKLRVIVGDAVPILIRQHPAYDITPPTEEKQLSTKLQALFIGLIRPYKGLDVLLDAYEKLTTQKRAAIELTVVGETWQGKEELARRLRELGIMHRLEFVTDQEMTNYIHKSDVVVLPYRSATGSGVIPRSFYLLRPVVATKVGGLAEVVDDGKTGWLIPPNDSSVLASILSTITPQRCERMHPAIRSWVNENSWDKMAEAIVAKFC